MKTTEKWNKMFLLAMLGIMLALGLVLVGCDTGSGDSSSGSSGGTTTYEYCFSNYSSKYPVTVNISGYGSFTLGTSAGWQRYVDLSYKYSSLSFTYSPTANIRYQFGETEYEIEFWEK
ncbi:hypothetical protein FACS1894172_11650 [Spirochaetia bacterium]|nr:hypothetical protein FACS1894172_11650 [Spirochaetia bacterium]